MRFCYTVGMDTYTDKLADALSKLASAIERQTRVLELLTAGMKPGVEAKILGVSVRTVSRRRKIRRMQKLLT